MTVPAGVSTANASSAAASSAAAGSSAAAQQARGSDYAELSRQIREAGLTARRPGHYALQIAVTAALLVGGWVAVVLVGNSWWQLAVAAFLAIVFSQLGFLGHDAGHRQITGSRRTSYILGLLLGDLGIGLSFGWWVGKHNRHHAHPNTEGADPDINMKVLAFTPEQASAAGGLSKAMFRWQAYFFFPLLFGEAISLHVSSIRSVLSRSGRARLPEGLLLAAHFASYLAILFVVLPPLKAIVFIVVQQGLFGLYMGAAFAPNHKGMPVLTADDKTDFLRRQVLTSRNVRGGWFNDLLLGGLNYQIEHHLFPSMPRPNLRRSQPLIRDFCLKHDLPYCQASLFGSYGQAVRYLNSVGRQTVSTVAANSAS
jgi:fatty acid desaturase